MMHTARINVPLNDNVYSPLTDAMMYKPDAAWDETIVRGGMSACSMMNYEENNPMNIDIRNNDHILHNTHTHT